MAKTKERLYLNVAKIRQRRNQLGLTLKTCQSRSGISVQSWALWEQGQTVPRVSNFVKIAEALECRIEDLMDISSRQFLHASRQLFQETIEDTELSAEKRAYLISAALRVFPTLFQDTLLDVENTFQRSLWDWRNPDLYAFESENCMEVVHYAGKTPLVVSGPTRCAKTLRILEMIVGLHMENKGFRSLVLRSDAVDLEETVRRDLRDVLFKYNLEDPLSPISAEGRGGAQNFKGLAINEGEMVLGGMNRPGRVLGTSYNLIFCSQIEQFTEEQFNFLLTRCAGDCDNWFDDDGNRRGLLIADANPDTSDHWILEYEAAGKLVLLNFSFDDNPLYHRKGKRTEAGETVINQLDTSLTGIYHDRFFKGIWCSVEGRVFVLDEKVHLIEPSRIRVGDYVWYRACDFGIVAPSVCLWIGEHRVTGDFVVKQEYRQTGIDTIELGNQIKHYSRGIGVVETVIDSDLDKQMLLRKHAGIPAVVTEKNAYSVEDGIHLIADGLRKAVEGKRGGLYFSKGLRLNADPYLVREKKPLSVVDEMRLYVVNPDTDKPLKENDHGIDALRYFFLHRAKRQGAVGFGSRVAQRQGRV